ncbi:hypothetical protein CsSME_00018916 [Camellia sinensis var. sinensis]
MGFDIDIVYFVQVICHLQGHSLGGFEANRSFCCSLLVLRC